jgi:putative ABC transport system permease protein
MLFKMHQGCSTVLNNYTAAARRNLMRNRLHAAINIAGLAVGFAAAMLVALFIRDERSYDRFWPGYERIYRLYSMHKFPSDAALHESDGTIADAVDWLKLEFPAIQYATRVATDQRSVRHGEIESDQQIAWADPDMFDVFESPVVAGDLKSALSIPDGVVLTRAMARKYFGQDAPVGESLQIDRRSIAKVTAVIEDLPPSTHLELQIIGSTKASFAKVEGTDVPTYVRLKPGTSVRSIEQAMDGAISRRESLDVTVGGQQSFRAHVELHMHLLPLTAVHLHRVSTVGVFDVHPDRGALYGLGAIGALILIVACLNYVNLMTARAARRAVEVGVRKAAGATRGDLISQFIGESLIYVVLALVVAVALVELILPALNGYLQRGIKFTYVSDPLLALGILSAGLVAGILAGAYPAFVLSAFRPVVVLKGQQILGTGSGLVRQSLVVIQFAVLIGLILSAGVIYRQTSFAMNEGLRLNKDQVVILRTSCNAALKNEVQSLPGVRAVACSSSAPLKLTASSGGKLEPQGKGLRFELSMVDFQFFELYGLRPLAGRFFDQDHSADAVHADEGGTAGSAVVINEELRRQLGIKTTQAAIGLTLDAIRPLPQGQIAVVPSQIIGVVPDFPMGSITEPAPPVCFYIDPSQFQLMSVKLTGRSIPETLDAIRGVWRRVAEAKPIDLFFFERHTAQLYASIMQVGTLLAVAAGIAVFIGCLGLFALSAFTTERRTKEIGVRKALGATRLDIVRMLIWEFSRPVLWANLAVWPISFYFIDRWLRGFAYHIDLAPWMFAAAGLGALVIAWVTVIGHTARVAAARPVKSLRYE